MQWTFHPSESGLYIALSRDGARQLCDIIVNGVGDTSVVIEDGHLYPIGQVFPGRKFIGPISLPNNAPKPQNDFRNGDLVVLNGGGRVMRVVHQDELGPRLVRCSCWVNSSNPVEEDHFYPQDLVLLARPGENSH